MTKTPRPSLASLGDHLAKKPATAPEPQPVQIVASAGKDERVQLMVRVTPAERKTLRRIALDQDTTVQALIEEAARDVIRRHDGKTS